MQISQGPPEQATRDLLTRCGLPTADVRPSHLEDFFACGQPTLDGVVGVEFHGPVALLRSLAVADRARGRGCGRALVARAERHAWSRGAGAIYLLTTTAEPFFAALGYRRIDRALAPAEIAATSEFSSLCPASSVLMVKVRDRDPSAR